MVVGSTDAAAGDTPVATLAGPAVADAGASIGASVAVASASRVSAGCDTSLVRLLRAAAVVVTGSVVCTAGAALARASPATFPVSAGWATSWLGVLTLTLTLSVAVASTGCAAASTGAIVPATSWLSVLTLSVTVASTGCAATSTGAVVPATSWVRVVPVSVTEASVGCAAASTGAIPPTTSLLRPPTVPSGGAEPLIAGLNEPPSTMD